MDGSIYARQFGMTGFTFERNLEGVSQEDSLVSPTPGGNNINWVVGHILATRNMMHGMLGLDPCWGEEQTKRYDRGSAPITADDAADIGDMQAAFGKSQEAVLAFLENADDAALRKEFPEEHPLLGKSVQTALTALAFHEAYHAGQVGVLRRVAGKDGAIA